jgi:4-nitrophenyl phosphatase
MTRKNIVSESNGVRSQKDLQLRDIRGLLVDLDGVIHVGKQILPGVDAFLDFIQRRSIGVIYITNNSTVSLETLGSRLSRYGLNAGPDQLLTSVTATLAYLRDILEPGTNIYAVGERGLHQALEEAGFSQTGGKVDAVVVGLDREFSYEKIERAASEILAGAKFIACNMDSGAPKEDGIAPGAGAMVAAIKAVVEVEPVIIGKPEPMIFQEGIRRLKLPKEQCAAIGDRLDVDILCAKRAGITAILLLTGLTKADMIRGNQVEADFVFSDLNALIRTWDEVLEGS